MLKKILYQLIYSLIPVHEAKTAKEKSAIYRFRYDLYVEKMNMRFIEIIDDEKKLAYDQIDKEKNTYLFYIGSLNNIKAAARVKIWHANEIPTTIKIEYDLPFLSNITEGKVAEVSRLMTKKSKVSKLYTLSLLMHLYYFVLHKNIDLILCNCLPGLVKYYQQMGFLTHTAKLINYAFALAVPLVFFVFDIEYLKLKKSPVYPIIKKYFKNHNINKKKKLLLEKYKTLITNNDNAVISDKELMYKSIEHACNNKKIILLNYISLAELNNLASLIISIEKNKFVFTSDIVDKELYFIIQGKFSIIHDHYKIGELKKGDLFGEMAFFLTSGKRTATIKALQPSKILVIRRNDLQRTIQQSPQLGVKLLFAIAQILTTRLKKTTRILAQEHSDARKKQ